MPQQWHIQVSTENITQITILQQYIIQHHTIHTAHITLLAIAHIILQVIHTQIIFTLLTAQHTHTDIMQLLITQHIQLLLL